ncbi:hypothetical protein [Streptomyces virginiae]|uniref:hypothetical protein n=1 Tax=Streptomyces virginiae TaxID=1961 RepID=UPI003444082D
MPENGHARAPVITDAVNLLDHHGGALGQPELLVIGVREVRPPPGDHLAAALVVLDLRDARVRVQLLTPGSGPLSSPGGGPGVGMHCLHGGAHCVYGVR